MRQFFILPNTFEPAAFHIRSYERFHYDKNFQTKNEHTHNFAEIFFITEGRGFFRTADKDIPIRRGMVIINNPCIRHTELSHPYEELEYAVLCVTNISFKSLQKGDYRDTFFIDFSSEYEKFFDFIKKIEWEWNIRELFWQYALQSYFNDYIVTIAREAKLFTLPFTLEDTSNTTLSQVYLYLTSKYQEDITLDKLSEMFSINKFYLSHAFKKLYGETVINTLNKIRCQEAENTLKGSDYSVSETAALVGFNSISHFSKVYTKIIGESPKQTKKNVNSKK